MSTSAVPSIIDALVTQARTALPSVTVVDGLGRTNNIGDTLMIGVDDPDTQFASASSDSSQDMATAGTTRSRDQRGSITCAALSWDGDSVAKTARDAAYAIQAAVETILRGPQNLSLTAYPLLVCELGSERLTQNVYEDGCDALLIFTVNFWARL